MPGQDILYEAFSTYETLLGRNFLISLEDGYSFVLSFHAKNFSHLIGLHYLSDIDQIRRSKGPARTYKEIDKKMITHDVIKKSTSFQSIRERIVFFPELPTLLTPGTRVVHPFDGQKSFSKITGDVMLYRDNMVAYLNLSCVRDAMESVAGAPKYAPQSFVIEHSTRFYDNNPITAIDTISELVRGA